MKNSTPRQVAIFAALLSTAINGIALILLKLPIFQPSWVFQSAIVIIIFIIVFFIVFKALNNFLIEKIHPIYKTISSFTISEEDIRKKMKDKDILSHLNKKVVKWIKTKTREIAELKKLEKYRREFMGNVSHELKTPIFTIQGYVLTLLDGALEDEKINRSYLEKAEKSINRMISIVEDLESISQLESGQLILNYENFNIVTLIEEIFENLEIKAIEKKIALIFTPEPERNIIVYADRKRIYEVLNNLLVNSINYGKENGNTSVSFMDMGNNILIDITDNGIGIAEKDIPRIFERFFRTDKSRSREAGGTGLGLSIVKHIIEAHNQTINVSSKLGVGSSFSITLKKGKTGKAAS
ncbi:MAG: sensor histidine kinase [Bacteroidales bacterium]|nr:sensor histidine kinase [Bacteroidales bacterium]